MRRHIMIQSLQAQFASNASYHAAAGRWHVEGPAAGRWLRLWREQDDEHVL